MKEGLLIKYGEIALRGKNRFLFENKLINAIRKNIPDEYYIKKEQGRLLIETRDDSDVDLDLLIPRVKKVLGVASVCPCILTKEHDIENLKALVLDFVKSQYEEDVTFKIISKRSDKNYPMTSQEISAEIGGHVVENTDNFTVDVVKPQVIVYVELRTNVYIYSKIIKGIGGLTPDGSSKVMLLLSGGIDSPVAGYLTARRGVMIEAVYFHSPPYTSERAKDKVIDLAKQISSYTGGVKLHVVPFTEIQLKLHEKVQMEKLTILLKRTMIRIADKLADVNKVQALAMGDSIGQVASQTMHSLKAVESATTLPIIRPLATYTKQEIIDLAREIGTYEISIRPYEDCCTIFVAKHPETKPKASIIENIERRISDDLDELIEKAIENIEIVEV